MASKVGSLHNAIPIDRPHLLVCDRPLSSYALERISLENDARIVSYRDDLLRRLEPNEYALHLNRELDRECDALRQLARDTSKPVLVVSDLDILLTNLSTHSHLEAQTFVHRLMWLRQLPCLVWIVWPIALLPHDWPKERLIYYDKEISTELED